MMSWGTRVFLALAFGVTLMLAAAVAVSAAAVHHAGAIAVEFEPDGGDQTSVRFPAALANLAIMIVPAEPLREITGEFDSVWPALRDGLDELVRAPDFVLLEVRERDEHVVVRKVGRRLVVTVETGDERVRLELPLTTVRRVVSKLDA
jgi:hypothetical protein